MNHRLVIFLLTVELNLLFQVHFDGIFGQLEGLTRGNHCGFLQFIHIFFQLPDPVFQRIDLAFDGVYLLRGFGHRLFGRFFEFFHKGMTFYFLLYIGNALVDRSL